MTKTLYLIQPALPTRSKHGRMVVLAAVLAGLSLGAHAQLLKKTLPVDKVLQNAPGTAPTKAAPPMLKPPPPAAQSGLAKIMNAGDLNIAGAPPSNGAPFKVSTFIPSADPRQGARIATTSGFKGKVDTAVRKVEDAIFLGDAGAIYPGALLQGQGFTTGNFTPLTIPRSGGRVAISNVTLNNGSVYAKTLPEITRDAVQAAVQEMLAQGVLGTAAGASFTSYETSSQSKLLFDLGVDVRYGSVAVNGQLNVQNSKTKNYVFACFKQKYYDISYTPPTNPTDVFKDGVAFADPQNQIRSGNPPLYVSKVTYGRMVFFVAESESSSSDVSAALNAAYNGTANVKVNSKLTASEILNSTRISYLVVGGNAGLALKPIASANADMFTAVKGFIANEGAANYSPSTPGVPIAYSLKYLKNNGDALMAYSSEPYDQSDIQYTNLPAKWSTKSDTTLSFNDPDGDENTINVHVDWNVLPNNVMEFVLVQPAGHTFPKWMKILRSNNVNSFEEVAVGSVFPKPNKVADQIGLYTNEIGPRSAIIFAKGKVLGVKTEVFSLTDGFDFLQPGSRVTFTWLYDSKGQQ
jgi:hypothetical protein